MAGKMKRGKTNVDNNAWITSHFEEIVNRYGGKVPYILVSKGRIFPIKPGDDIVKIERRITHKYGKPVGMPVPSPEDFTRGFLFLIPPAKD